MNFEFSVDGGFYPVDVVMAAAYVFTERCYVLLDPSADGRVKVSLSAKAGVAADALSAIAGEFQNELLAQALRRRVADRHEKVREFIVARALFGAAPTLEARTPPDDARLGIDPKFVPAGDDDFLDDPLGIAVPWEEKYGDATTAVRPPEVTEPKP